MAYNHGQEERKWRIWKENEEKILRECGVSESIIEEIRNYDRMVVFNSDRRFYRRLNDVGEYIEDTAEQEQVAEIQTVMELLDAAAVTKVWSYVGELIFNMLILVDAVKMADRVVREMMGL